MADSNDDAYCCNLETQRFAVADGVSGSFFAAKWAHILVQYFTSEHVSPFNLREWIRIPCQTWDAAIDWDRFKNDPKNWWYEDMRLKGAASTLLGFGLESLAGDKRSFARWYALAVGDSCLFQVRKNRLVRSFPMTAAQDFTNEPWVLSSIATRNFESAMVQVAEGDCRSGDFFLLMTDAIARWFLVRKESRRAPWEELTGLKSLGDFRVLVTQNRKDGLMRNDDTTLVIVKV